MVAGDSDRGVGVVTPRVYSARRGAGPVPPGAIYVGRPTQWGNPFTHRTPRNVKQCKVKTLAEAIRRFQIYAADRLLREPDWLDPLTGKDLVCWCHGPDATEPACHADTLLFLANEPRCTTCGDHLYFDSLVPDNVFVCASCFHRP